VLAGSIRVWRGSYQISFIGAGLLCLLAALMVLQIGKQRRAQPLGEVAGAEG
jgi:hypothetical protein